MAKNPDLLWANISLVVDLSNHNSEGDVKSPNMFYMNCSVEEWVGFIGYNSVVTQNEKAIQGKSCSQTFLFVWYTIIVGICCLLGFAGNTVSFIILQHDKGNQVATLLLQTLAIGDNSLLALIFITVSIFWGAMPYFSNDNTFLALKPYLLKYLEPIGYMTKTFAIWITVLLAINRYVVIKKPLKVHIICTLRRAYIQIGLVLIVSVVCNLPRFFEYDIVTVTTREGNLIKANVTDIGKGSMFSIVYTNVVYNCFVILLPIVLMIVLNTSLIIELRKMNKARAKITSTARQSENNITLVMCVIIIIFITCHMPDRILQGVRSFKPIQPQITLCYLVAICNFLIVINSSTNFVVYFFVRKRFRNVLAKTLCPGCPSQQEENSTALNNRTSSKANLQSLSTSFANILNKQVKT